MIVIQIRRVEINKEYLILIDLKRIRKEEILYFHKPKIIERKEEYAW